MMDMMKHCFGTDGKPDFEKLLVQRISGSAFSKTDAQSRTRGLVFRPLSNPGDNLIFNQFRATIRS